MMLNSYSNKIKAYFDERKWKLAGSPTVSYLGYYCATCDNWQRKPFKVRTYLSKGRLENTSYKVCEDCRTKVKKDD